MYAINCDSLIDVIYSLHSIIVVCMYVYMYVCMYEYMYVLCYKIFASCVSFICEFLVQICLNLTDIFIKRISIVYYRI